MARGKGETGTIGVKAKGEQADLVVEAAVGTEGALEVVVGSRKTGNLAPGMKEALRAKRGVIERGGVLVAGVEEEGVAEAEEDLVEDVAAVLVVVEVVDGRGNLKEEVAVTDRKFVLSFSSNFYQHHFSRTYKMK